MLNLSNKLHIRIVFIIGFILLLSACENRPKGVLNKNEMVKVLVDMHKADALIMVENINFESRSNINPYYKFVLKKYGITQANFDSSLVWYNKNPQKFTTIYKDVVTELTAFQKEIKNGKYHPVDTISNSLIKSNIWNKRTKYILTKDSARTRLDFQIPYQGFLYKDVFVLKLLQRIAPEDSSKRQRIILRINYWNGKTDSVSKMAYHDSLLRRYTFRFPAIHKYKIKSISGELLGSSSYKGKLNAFVDSISLMREFDYKMQDSIRKLVEKEDPTNYEIVRSPKPVINNSKFQRPMIRPDHKALPQKQ